MHQYLKHFFVLALLTIVFSSCKAQKFTTHAVKNGETLTGISKEYGVDTATILRYNKEIGQGDQLKPNTILVIPRGVKPVTKTTSSTTVSSTDSVSQSSEPIGFTSHRVRKRETLYGIAQRFRVSEDDLKKYNPELYSSQLKKNMTLKIPKYRRTKSEQMSADLGDVEIYTVASKETRWSIANKYGITIDSMLALNPELSTSSDYLAEGQELKMPKPAGSSLENQKTQLYLSYTVPPKMNFYQLEKKFGIKSDEIIRLNPEITEKGGLKENMVIRIPQVKQDAGEINTDNYNFYVVKPKQTEFSLTRKLGLTYKELLELNPELNDGLKAGMVLKLPKEQKGEFEVRNSLLLDKINLADSINVQNKPKVVFMFPFRLDKLNLSNKEEVAEIIEDRNSLKYSLGLYSGALVALDSIAAMGVSVDVRTFDNELSLAKTKEILQREDLKTVSAIIGPLDVASLKETAVRSKNYQVPVIAPVPAESDLSLSNVFYSYTSNSVLRERILDFAADKYEGQNVVIIADSTNVIAKDSIMARFPDAKITRVIEEEKNIGIKIDSLKANLSDEVENWVFVETNNFKLVASVSSILNSFQNTLLDIEEPDRDKLQLRMFTTNKSPAFDNDVISGTHLSNLQFTYPSVYRVPVSNSFSRRYEKRFGSLPDRYAVRGFDLTYDLLLRLAYKNDLIEASRYIGETEYSGNKFDYEKDFEQGYYNRASYIMVYKDLRIVEVK